MKSPKVYQRMNGIISLLRSKQQPVPSHPTLQKDLGVSLQGEYTILPHRQRLRLRAYGSSHDMPR